MLELKDYQKSALVILQYFLEQARLRTPGDAFARTVTQYPTDSRPQTYHTRWNLENTPYVCLRLPTGGGKTLLAAHSIGLTANSYLDRDWPLVLWLVPTNTIRQQTVKALKNPGHPYRQALTVGFGEQGVAIFDIEEINNIHPKDSFEKACIVVATMQTLRVSEANKIARKVYGHSESFEPHFAKLANTMPGLDRDENGQVLYSFVNMLHQLRPLVIVDEAHKMISQLSGEVMARINPACVIEFTATPVESNVLFRAFPSELKNEEMVKLPFNLLEHQEWEGAVRGAMMTRVSLAELAAQDSQYIRPLVLFQAEKANQSCTVSKLKQFLLSEGAKEEEIAIATGEQRELDSIDIFDRECSVKYIITIEALKEGWDCSFAYVFCSVANISSAIDVEQLLGRVMRMPYAASRKAKKLNMAYAHVVSSGFGKAAAEMNTCLCNMGFDEEEANENIQQLSLTENGKDIWGDTPLLNPQKNDEPGLLEISLDNKPDFSGLDKEDIENIKVEKKGDIFTIFATGMITKAAEDRIVAAAKKEAEYDVKNKISQHRRKVIFSLPPDPASRGVKFEIPLLCWEKEEILEPADAENLLDSMWSPLDELPQGEPLFSGKDFNYDPKVKAFQFDLAGEKMTYKLMGELEQGFLYTLPQSYDKFALARWLDRACQQSDISQADMLELCRRAVQSLLDSGHDIEVLFHGKKIISQLLGEKIIQLRARAKQIAFQKLLDGRQKTRMEFNQFSFPTADYAENIPRYQGAFQFKKHYLGVPRDLKNKGEEFRCAQALDMHPHVEMWFRNVDRQKGSFFLPTSSDNFYPDFIAKLIDDRILVIEYKGDHIINTPDTLEKINIGKFWADKSDGKGVFALVCETRDEYRFEKQMCNIIH